MRGVPGALAGATSRLGQVLAMRCSDQATPSAFFS
jgi:hypothetical protein